MAYSRSFLFAVAIHFILLCVLLFGLEPPAGLPGKVQPKKPVRIVKATAINSAAVIREIERIKAEKAKAQQARITKQRKAEQALAKAKAQRLAEEKRIVQAKAAHAKKIKEQKRHAAKVKRNLAALKQKQAVEKKRLQQAERKRRTAEAQEKKRQAAAKRVAEAKREKDAKRKAREAKRAAIAEKAKREAEEKARALYVQGQMNKFTRLIRSAISRQWVVPESISQDLSCKLFIKLAPGGRVLEVKVVKSSGNIMLDRSARNAVYKASPLPVPDDAKVFAKFREVILTVRPENILPGR